MCEMNLEIPKFDVAQIVILDCVNPKAWISLVSNYLQWASPTSQIDKVLLTVLVWAGCIKKWLELTTVVRETDQSYSSIL